MNKGIFRIPKHSQTKKTKIIRRTELIGSFRGYKKRVKGISRKVKKKKPIARVM